MRNKQQEQVYALFFFPDLALLFQVYPSQTSILLNRCPHIIARDHSSNSSEMIQPYADTKSRVKTGKRRNKIMLVGRHTPGAH